MTPTQHVATAKVGRWSIRIFESPRTGPDHPWASWDDFMAVPAWDDELRADWWATMSREAPDMLHTLPDGTRLVAQVLVGGLFQAWVLQGVEPAQDLLDQWWDAWMEVFCMLHHHLPREEWLAVCQRAALRNVSLVPGETVLQ